jgi:hypothetical protein
MTEELFDGLDSMLGELHRRERDGLSAFKAAVTRANEMGLALGVSSPAPRVALPLPAVISPPPSPAPVPTKRRGRKPGRKAKLAVAEASAPRRGRGQQPSELWRTAKMLCNLKQNGHLRNGEGRGRYQGGRASRPPSPPPPAPLKAPARPMTPTGSMVFPSNRRGQQIAAVEAIALRLGPGVQWSANEMEAWVGREHPHLVNTPGRCSDLRVRLIDMAGDGLLLREGVGGLARYRLGARLANRNVPESPGAVPLRISVPRDSDAGGGS